MFVQDGAVTGNINVDLITIHIDNIQYFEGLSRKGGNLLLDTITSYSTAASYLFKYQGEDRVIHSVNVAPLGRVLTALLGR